MSATDGFEGELLDLLFLNTSIANIGDATGIVGSTAAGNAHIAIFTADPTDTGSVTNECDYTSYARVAVARNGSNWSRSGNEVDNVNPVSFPASTGGGDDTATHYAWCKGATPGVADLLIVGALGSSLLISSGVTPEFAAGDCNFSAD